MNINIPDIIDRRPSIILGLVWTIILRCHVSIAIFYCFMPFINWFQAFFPTPTCFRLRSWPVRCPLAPVIPPWTLCRAWTPGPAARSRPVRSLLGGYHLCTGASVFLPKRPCSCGSETNAKSRFNTNTHFYFVLGVSFCLFC